MKLSSFFIMLWMLLGTGNGSATSLPPFGFEHIVPMELNGQKVWAKKPDPKKAGLRGCFKNALARLIPLAILRPTYSCSAAQTLKTEMTRIHVLKAQGVLVPDIIDATPEWIILSDLGPTIESLMMKTPPGEGRKNIALQAAEALGTLHQKGQWHGRGDIRDMTLSSAGTIGFIDFEENPQGPFSFKQARDFLMFLFSVSTFLENPEDLKSVIQAYRDIAPKTSYLLAFIFFKTAAPFIELLKIAPLGRDGVRLLYAVKLIDQAWSLKQ